MANIPQLESINVSTLLSNSNSGYSDYINKVLGFIKFAVTVTVGLMTDNMYVLDYTGDWYGLADTIAAINLVATNTGLTPTNSFYGELTLINTAAAGDIVFIINNINITVHAGEYIKMFEQIDFTLTNTQPSDGLITVNGVLVMEAQ